MVERIDVGTIYRSDPLTSTPIDEFPESAFGDPEDNLNQWLRTIIEVNELEYESFQGFGGFRGLQERADTKVRNIELPKCGKSFCGLEIELEGAGSGTAQHCQLSASCPRIEGPDQDEVEATETTCRQYQDQALQHVAFWLWQTVSTIRSSQQEIKRAEAEIEAAKRKIRDLV